MNVKTKDFVAFTQQSSIFKQTQDLQWAGVGITEVIVTPLPRQPNKN